METSSCELTRLRRASSTRAVARASGAGALISAAAVLLLISSFARPAAALEPERDARTATLGGLPQERELPANGADHPGEETPPALALLPQGMPPRVLIRFLAISDEARQRAEKLAKILRENGFEVADVRQSAVPLLSELKFFYAPDQSVAQRIGRLASLPSSRGGSTKDGLTIRPGTIELDISGR